MKREIAYRNLNPQEAQFRATTIDGKKFLEGYASIFNQRSKPIFENGKWFYEIIATGAFDEVLASPEFKTKLNFNHMNGQLLARTESGTLQLSVDEKGLFFKAEAPNTTTGNDVVELVSRGDLFECSFAFIVKRGDDTWTMNPDSADPIKLIRTVNKVSRLADVSIVTDGAYAGTEVAARGKTITIIIEDDDPEEEDPELVIEDMPMMDPSIGESEDVETDGCGDKKPKRENQIYNLQDSFKRKLKILNLKLNQN